MASKIIKKVLLLTPPAFTFRDMPDINPVPPLGLGYIAAVLERRGVEVRIYDSLIENTDNAEDMSGGIVRIGASFDEIAGEIAKFSPDMVGVSNLFSRQAPNAHKIYETVKRADPNIIIVAGGAHPSVMPELVMNDKNVDFVIIGEGEHTICGILDHLEGRIDINSLDGVAFRKDGMLHIIPKKTFISDLDKLPFPARHLMRLDKYFGLKDSHGKRRALRFSPIVTSRGCPAGCSFCTAHHVWGRPFRKRSPQNVIEEMRLLKDTYRIEELLFEDDNVTLDAKRAEGIFDAMIEEKMGFIWDTPNGVAAFALDEKLIKKMRSSGCYKLNIAVESGNKHVLKNIIRKPLDLEKVKRLIKYAKGIGLETCIFLIIGMPGETLSQMWDSYRFSKEVGIFNPFVSIATPYPGSDLYALCVEKGYINDSFSLDKLYITSCSISTDKWTGEDVRRLFKKGYTYLQFHYYIRHPLSLTAKLAEKALNDPKTVLRKAAELCQCMKN